METVTPKPTLSLSACLRGEHNEELNVRVCELRGWKLRKQGKHPVTKEQRWVTIDPEGRELSSGYDAFLSPIHIPNHILTISALGNCAEMEAGLTTELECAAYATELAKLVKGFPFDPFVGVTGYIWHATPLHRVIAYLRVKSPGMFGE